MVDIEGDLPKSQRKLISTAPRYTHGVVYNNYRNTKPGCYPITIPKHEPIKRVYVQKVKEIVEADLNDKD